MSQHPARITLSAFVCLIIAMLAVSVARVAFAGTGDGSVSVATEASSYAPGHPLTATVVNGTATPIAPHGGIVCRGSPWPFGVQRLDDAGNWQDVTFPRTPPCIGIAVELLGPGQSQTWTFEADANVGTYRLAYVYSAADGSGQALAVSASYEVTPTAID